MQEPDASADALCVTRLNDALEGKVATGALSKRGVKMEALLLMGSGEILHCAGLRCTTGQRLDR